MFTRCLLALAAGLLTTHVPVFAQTHTVKKPAARPAASADPYRAVDARMQQVPDSATRTATGLARYIRTSFSTEADRARAAFIWVARHIRYDHENMYVLEFEREPAVVAQETLDKRRGVCRHFAELYNAVARHAGLQSYLVPGYTSLRNPVGHAWCATRIDGQWYLMDPTWALETRRVNGKPLEVLRNDYYRMKPATAIDSHMPFDPLWQLLAAPRTPMQFQLGTVPPPPVRPFHYADSVAVYEQQNLQQRLRATNRRVEQNGVKSGLIFSFLSNNRVREANYLVEQDNQQRAIFNEANDALNAGLEELNTFIEYYNRQFQPRKPDTELAELLAPAEAQLGRARALLNTVHGHDAQLQNRVQQAQALLTQSEAKLHNSQAFLTRYLRTGKLLRPTMFMQLDAARNEMLR